MPKGILVCALVGPEESLSLAQPRYGGSVSFPLQFREGNVNLMLRKSGWTSSSFSHPCTVRAVNVVEVVLPEGVLQEASYGGRIAGLLTGVLKQNLHFNRTPCSVSTPRFALHLEVCEAAV